MFVPGGRDDHRQSINVVGFFPQNATSGALARGARPQQPIGSGLSPEPIFGVRLFELGLELIIELIPLVTHFENLSFVSESVHVALV